jgi:hypothetical protein
VGVLPPPKCKRVAAARGGSEKDEREEVTEHTIGSLGALAFVERSLGEVKRRTKVIGRFPGEDSRLTLVRAVPDLAITNETNGIRFTQPDRQHLNRIRHQDPEQTIPEEVTAAWTDHHREPRPRRIYSAKRTPPRA